MLAAARAGIICCLEGKFWSTNLSSLFYSLFYGFIFNLCECTKTQKCLSWHCSLYLVEELEIVSASDNINSSASWRGWRVLDGVGSVTSGYTAATGIEAKLLLPGSRYRAAVAFWRWWLSQPNTFLVVLGIGVASEWWFFKHGIFERDYHVCALLASEKLNQNQQLFSISLFHKLLAETQRSSRATGKIEGVQGLREEQG